MKWTFTLSTLIILFLTLSPAEEKAQRLKEAMQKKLRHAQGVLAGVAKQDFPQIRKHAEQLHAITEMPHWQRFKTEKYRLYSSEFGRIANMISQSAKRKKS